ncbi:MAG: iron ABC transporter permease, partial [Bacillota bacterium]|nr:iron ABC transporter permease [Bacillota bacterium]
MKQYTEHKNAKKRIILAYAVSIVLLIVFVFANIGLGSVKISPADAVSTLLGRGNDANIVKILWNIRLPRMIAALILGGALSLSGFLLQTYFGNPIAGPFILGISSGAKLAVALLLVFVIGTYKNVSSGALVTAAFAGSMIVMAFVLLVSRKIKRPSALIISGVMVGYICSAITDFIITFGSDASIVNLHNWSKGSFSGTSWSNVQFIAVSVALTSFLVFWLSKPIGALQLGENYAKSLGVNIRLIRVLIVITSGFLSACVTAFAGPI